MPRSTPSRTTYVCSECGGESIRWAGQCPHCRAWNTLQEFTVKAQTRAERSTNARHGERSRPLAITAVEDEAAPRAAIDWTEINRVLGGGIVKGSLVLVGGEPGVGKSTLLMHVAQQVANSHGTVLYASGEESAQQVRLRAARLKALHERLLVLAENDLDTICDAISES